MTARARLGTLLIAASLLAHAGSAMADERSDARRHFRAGMEMITDRRYADGIRELEAAYAILPHPNVLYNIARAYNDMGDTEHALEYLRRYLTHDVSDRAEVETIIARLEARLRERQTGGPAATTGGPETATTTTSTTTATPQGSLPMAPTFAAPPAGTRNAGDYRAMARALLQLADAIQGTRTTITTAGTPVATASSGPPVGTSPTTVSSGAPPSSSAPLASVAPPSSRPPASSAPPAAVASARPPSSPVPPASSARPGTVAVANVGIARREGEGEEVYEERVVTASRAAQSPLDAPNATGVITAQDIRLSGLTNVAELLRRIVGVDVMELDGSDIQVSARGFNQRLSNKMLVLVDGRSVYLDFMGVTLWPAIPVSVEDIDRIEVIRGPGSALYGADAFTGVVNIITRPPGESRTQVSLGIGNGQWLRGSFFTSGRQGPIAYRASASYEQRATYGLPVSPSDRVYQLTAPDRDISFRAPRVDLEARMRLGPDATLRAGLGVAASTAWFQAIGPLRRYWSNVLFAQPFVQLDVGGFTARFFYNRFHADAAPLLLETGRNFGLAHVEQDVADLDLQYALRSRLGAFTNTFQVGLGGRLKHISWNYLTPTDPTLLQGLHASLYLQDTLRSEHFIAVASVRGDYDGALPVPIFSPRGSLIYRPTSRRAIRLSGGTAFRTPTMLELYLDYPNTSPIPGVTVGVPGGEVAYQNCLSQGGAADVCGSRRLRPESALSFDLGYLDQTFDFLSLEANIFWTQARDLIQLSPIALDTVPGNTGTDPRINVGAGGFVNDPHATYVYGAEIGTRISPIEGLDIYANYTLSLTYHDPAALLSGQGLIPPDQRTPIHKFNVGVQIRTRAGFDFEAFGHYASRQLWLEQGFDPVEGVRYFAFQIPDYFVLNARVGYRMLGDRLELGLVGTDLTDLRIGAGHQEHPFGERLSLRVMATAAYRF